MSRQRPLMPMFTSRKWERIFIRKLGKGYRPTRPLSRSSASRFWDATRPSEWRQQ